MTTGPGQIQGPFSVSRHPLFRRAAHCWPSGGLFGCGQLACRQVTPGKPGCGRGITGDRGLFAPQSSCPGSSRRQGSHLPYTSVGLLRQQPVRCLPQANLVRYMQNSLCPAGRGEETHARKFTAYLDTLGLADGPAACIVMESSGRAGPAVVVDEAGGRETDHLNTRSARPLLPERISKPVRAWRKHHLAGDTMDPKSLFHCASPAIELAR